MTENDGIRRLLIAALSPFLCLALLFRPASAEEMTDQVTSAMRYLMEGSEKLTKQEYETFWRMMPKLSQSDRKGIVKSLKFDVADGLEYQRNLWRCARDGWVRQRITNCPDAFKIHERMIARSKSEGTPIGPMMDALENSKRLLAAASTRTSLRSHDGREVDMSLELIDSTMKTLDMKYSRVRDALK
jgi:hypothetical protein